MRRDYKGQRAWRTGNGPSSASSSPRMSSAGSSRPASASPFLASLTSGPPVVGGGLGSPVSPATVFARPRVSSPSAASGASLGGGVSPPFHLGTIADAAEEGEEMAAVRAAQKREELMMVGARTYDHWLAEKAMQVGR